MSEKKWIDLFCEDRGHESYAVALVKRLGGDLGVNLHVHTRCARGGHARAIDELRAFQRAFARGLKAGTPDLLIVVIDGNCQGWRQRRDEITAAIDTTVFPRTVIGCPDPHVERWCFADPKAFQSVVGTAAPADPAKCERGVYKDLLRTTLERAGQPVLTDPMEFAPEIVDAADLYAAGKAAPSLGDFITHLQGALKA